MKKDVLIQITGVQRVDGDEDKIEMSTVGRFYRREGNYYISYQESEATGLEGTRTTVKVEKGDALGAPKITLLRSGNSNSQLVIEPGMRHQCCYGTGYGELLIGISGESISAHLDDMGGDVCFRYAIDINSALASENEVSIKIKECVQ